MQQAITKAPQWYAKKVGVSRKLLDLLNVSSFHWDNISEIVHADDLEILCAVLGVDESMVTEVLYRKCPPPNDKLWGLC